MKKLEILHIASFSGNIGDNASHNGLYSLLKKYLEIDSLKIDELEIRKAYKNYNLDDKILWDEEFIINVNNHDLTVIGGGNFFAPWIEESKTGTMFDLSKEQILQMKKPLIFYSIGFDPYYGKYSKNTLKNFEKFINNLSLNPNILVAVRNDGSIEHIEKLINKNTANKIYEVPDSGFFIKRLDTELNNFCKDEYIAINLAVDGLEKRFSNSEIEYNEYLEELKKWFLKVNNKYKDIKFVFIPHIYSDLYAISDLLKLLPDKLIRENILVAPYLQGKNSEKIFNIYFNANLVIGNRFHTNVCSISQSVPTIGLVTYRKLKDLYLKLEIEDLMVDANKKDFSKRLYKLTKESLENRDRNRYKIINKKLETQVKITIENLKNIIKESKTND